MNLIEEAIYTYGKNFNYCFVFPSGLASGLWLKKSLDITGLSVLPSELYISWDVFKKRNLNFYLDKNSQPVEPVIRILYSEYLMNKNKIAAKNGKPLLNYIIPEQFAKTSDVFSSWITDILPQLDHWQKSFIRSNSKKDAESLDLLFIKKNYTDFLLSNNLFEPSWNAASFNSNGKKYIIVFPELIEDFSEYAELLKSSDEIRFLYLNKDLKKHFSVLEFADTRGEIKYIVSEIEKLLLKNVEPNEIAVSVANIEDIKPYLKREFEERDIPVEFRFGKTLSKNQAGLLFKSIDEIVQTHYSFASLKKLLLNKHIAWKNKDIVSALISFGIKNNCALSWQENKIWKNVWKEAFNTAATLSEDEYKAKEMFSLFSSVIEKIVTSKTFYEIQKNYFEFIDVFININEFSETDKNIISRCIMILNNLVFLENRMPEYMPENRFKFFLKILDNEIYVEQNTGLAVSIFPYGIAAGTPFKYHFIINVNQQDGSVIYNKLSFLRKDKKTALGVSDSDASLDFAAAYKQSKQVQFSYSKKLYNNYAIAHAMFNEFIYPDNNNEDSFKSEKLLFENKIHIIKTVYKKQYDSFFKYLGMTKKNKFSMYKDSFDSRSDILKREIQSVQYNKGNILVSATDLNKFIVNCPIFWFMEKILKISFEDFDAEIFNPRRTGNMYHYILENIYKRIKESDKYFIKENIPQYIEWAFTEIKKTTGKNIELRGPLAKPFIESMSSQIMNAIEFIFYFDSEKLNKYFQLIIEDKLEFLENGILYNGKIDRFVLNNSDAVILDYKKNMSPKFSDYNIENGKISDFQIPMYVFLSEQNILNKNNETVKITGAFFLKLIEQDFVPIIAGENIDCGTKRSGMQREEFEDRISILKQSAEKFKEKISKCDFIPESIGWEKCSSCRFKKICRTTFMVRGQ